MDGNILSIVLDVIVLFGLAGTIFYCIRLSKALNNFRQYRQEFNTLVGALSKNIDQASLAIESLKNASFEAGEDLQKVVTNARALCDELQLMNDMGNSLANRLERLSETGRTATSQKPDFTSEISATKSKNGYAAAKDQKPKAEKSGGSPSFFIQDREFDKDDFGDDNDHDFADDMMDDDGFESQAERELYQALMKNNKGKAL